MARSKQDRRKIHLVSGKGATSAKQERRKFATGEVATQSGIYEVVHEGHRLPHEVTLLSGQVFPPCAKCADAVYFRLIRPVLEDDTVSGFRVTLNQLPEIEAPAAESQADERKAS